MKNIIVPPLKIQGIKTKLIDFIRDNIQINNNITWIEPFLGSGSVAFNLAPKRALLSDSNPHIINLYKSIQNNKLTPEEIADHLKIEGNELSQKGESHYYQIRKRFNQDKNAKDFVFLNRCCFNGLIRFNKKGEFNVPFCKKNDRFRKALITKIYNQFVAVRERIILSEWDFVCQSWEETLINTNSNSFTYLDPPYVGRHTDYYSSWDEKDAHKMISAIEKLKGGYALSMWFENRYRKNLYLQNFEKFASFKYFSHFYHLGGSEQNRNKMIEALVIHPDYVKQNLLKNDLNSIVDMEFNNHISA